MLKTNKIHSSFIRFCDSFQCVRCLSVGHVTLDLAERSKKVHAVESLFLSFFDQIKYLVTSCIA